MLGELGLGFIESQKTIRFQQHGGGHMKHIKSTAGRFNLGICTDTMSLREPLMRFDLALFEVAFQLGANEGLSGFYSCLFG